MAEIRIRDYEERDWRRLCEIHDPARRMELQLAGLSDAFLPLTIAAVREGLFDYAVRVAEMAGEVVGFAAFSDEELAWLYVDPAHMRQGVGEALARRAMAEIPERPILLEVLAGNDPARRLYEKLGFAVRETVAGRMPGNEAFGVTVHCMEYAKL